MITLTTFGQLQAAIKEQTIEGMLAGYYFLAGILDAYLEIDVNRESPKLPCYQPEIGSDEEFQRALNEMPLTDDFWEYVERVAENLLDPIDHSIDTPGRDKKYWDAVENHNQDGGKDVLQFLERYRETTGV